MFEQSGFTVDRDGTPLALLGRKIVVEDGMVCTKRKRSLKERLFSRPFSPFRRYEVHYTKNIPDGKYVSSGGFLIMNSFTLKQLSKTLELEREGMR